MKNSVREIDIYQSKALALYLVRIHYSQNVFHGYDQVCNTNLSPQMYVLSVCLIQYIYVFLS